MTRFRPSSLPDLPAGFVKDLAAKGKSAFSFGEFLREWEGHQKAKLQEPVSGGGLLE